ncbi:histone H2A, sperm-like [Episyrphus balteatus]|uniref:histone H2A, sperm-like n=1 Tax=Episyrphus balteatus TaxID=286459 RepID=UPI0024868D41|nr:histone H2A, sperm-like [Episyrphus balteatus]
MLKTLLVKRLKTIIMSGAGKVFKIRRTRSSRAGINFPVSRVLRYLRKGQYADHIQVGASVYASTILEYLVAEILELSAARAKEGRCKRIKPRHILLAVRNDNELDELLQHVTIAEGGVIPHISERLLPKKSRLNKKK